MTVQNFVKILWTVFEKFEISMKRSGEKNSTIALVENFFRLLKIIAIEKLVFLLFMIFQSLESRILKTLEKL